MLLIPAKLTREFIISNSNLIFVHGRCYWPANTSHGPAAICKGLPNTYGIPVRWKLCKSSGYFSDTQEPELRRIIDKAIEAIPTTAPIVLFPKVGNGDSRMHIFAPKTWAYMMEQLNKIKAEYKYVYQ